jgi:C2 domain
MRTETKMNTNEPEWNARYEVAVFDPRLTVELRVRSLGRVHDSEVGRAELQLSSLFKKAHDAEARGSGVVTQDRWCSLIHKERACGMIHVRLEYVFSPLFDFVASFEEPLDFDVAARQSAAVDRSAEEELGYIDAFKQLRGNVYRFLCSVTPLLQAVVFVRDVLEWKNSALTLLTLFSFTFVVYHQLYLSAVLLGTAVLMMRYLIGESSLVVCVCVCVWMGVGVGDIWKVYVSGEWVYVYRSVHECMFMLVIWT